jgi:hypothetical protein
MSRTRDRSSTNAARYAIAKPLEDGLKIRSIEYPVYAIGSYKQSGTKSTTISNYFSRKWFSVMKEVMITTLFLILSIFCAAPLFSVPLEDLVGVQAAESLRSSHKSEVQLKNPNPVLLPNHGEIKRFVGEMQKGLEPSILVETLFLYQKPGGAAVWSEAERAGLFNQALAISTLAGIQYFSASRNAMRTFYETSYVIDSPGSKKAVPDPVYSAVPNKLSIYARQKDLTFGDNIYSYEYRSYPDAFVFMQENLSALNAGIVPAVGKNKLRSFMAVFDCGDSLLIYAASMAKAAPIPGMGERIGNSFTNRAEAVLKWYTARAAAVLGK